MYNSKFSIILFCCGFILLSTSCKKKPDPVTTTPPVNTGTTGTVGFEFTNYAGNTQLVMGSDTYPIASGETITVSKFNYFISNIHIKKSDGTEYVEPESYHLVQGNVASSKHFHLKDVPVGTYTSITFLIGVDSLRNVSGAQTGALDQGTGMYWSWVSGYIMAKLEGTLPATPLSPSKSFTWHIGGFAGANTGVRKVTLAFPTNMELKGGTEGTIDMKADMLKWFAPNNVAVGSTSEIMTASATSNKIADNYANMFSITKVLVTAE